MEHSASKTDRLDSAASLGSRYLFYRRLGLIPLDYLSLAFGYSASVWWPSPGKPWPSGVSSFRTRARFAFRCFLDCARLFANREVGAVCIYYADRLVHYSGFTPRYWRFPFLSDKDLQIGDTWTDPTHRGKGLASYALQEIMDIKQTRGRRFWYVVGDDNLPSIRVVEKADFKLVGVGDWRRPWGIKLLGSYVLEGADAESSLGVQSGASFEAGAVFSRRPSRRGSDPAA